MAPHQFSSLAAAAMAVSAGVVAPRARGEVRAAGDYEIAAEALDEGGGRAVGSGGDCVIQASIGGIGGISTADSTATTARHGFPGQIYQITGLLVTADPANVNEGQACQLEAAATCDDSTTLDIAPTGVVWEILSGPVQSVSATGLATTGAVFSDTGAVLRGRHGGHSGDCDLLVLNTGSDDYGSYAGDGIDDDWQVDWFGEDNPDAGPGENPDQDPDDNMSEFLTGCDPTDPAEWFRLTITAGGGATTSLEICKAVPDRIYTLKAGPAPGVLTETVASFSVTAEEQPKSVPDPTAGPGPRFYQVEVERAPP